MAGNCGKLLAQSTHMRLKVCFSQVRLVAATPVQAMQNGRNMVNTPHASIARGERRSAMLPIATNRSIIAALKLNSVPSECPILRNQLHLFATPDQLEFLTAYTPAPNAGGHMGSFQRTASLD
jgi:hypothetical protein